MEAAVAAHRGEPHHSPSVSPSHAGQDLLAAGNAVFMIGIGGCGMSGLARLIASLGCAVRGNDSTRSETTEALRTFGLDVVIGKPRPSADGETGHSVEGVDRLPQRCDLVVASAAVAAEHALLVDAQRRRIPVRTYAQTLGLAMARSTGVAVAGTHGKSTTAAMLGCVLTDAGLDPSVIVGAGCAQLERGCAGGGAATLASGPRAMQPATGFRLGASRIQRGPFAQRPGVLVAEACEFQRSFHQLAPTIACINNVEPDHLDVYGTGEAVREAFEQFAALVPDAARGGFLLLGEQCGDLGRFRARTAAEVRTIGRAGGAGGHDWTYEWDASERRVTLSEGEHAVAAWTMQLPGAHNAANAAHAAVLALRLGAEPAAVSASLGAFRGVGRRCEFLGVRTIARAGAGAARVRVWDDYGHHPTECRSTLSAIRSQDRPAERGGRLICVFQPHQHSRTRHLLHEFASAFADADVLIVPEIYFVRDSEREKQLISSADLVDTLREQGVDALHMHPFAAIVEHVERIARDGDTVLVMGAGPVGSIAYDLLNRGLVGGSSAPGANREAERALAATGA